jgi:hypothetical protein
MCCREASPGARDPDCPIAWTVDSLSAYLGYLGRGLEVALPKKLEKTSTKTVDIEPTLEDATVVVEAESGDIADDALVERACVKITEIAQRTLFKGMSDIGNYLLTHFFDDDPELARSKAPNKNASYRALLNRCETLDLPVKKSTLNNAVRIALQDRLMSDSDAYEKLSYTHKVRLLPLHDDKKTMKMLSKKAVSQKLSTRQLADLVSEHVVTGEPRTSNVTKALSRTMRVFTEVGVKSVFTRKDVQKMKPDEARKAHEMATALKKKLDDLLPKLQNKMDGVDE